MTAAELPATNQKEWEALIRKFFGRSGGKWQKWMSKEYDTRLDNRLRLFRGEEASEKRSIGVGTVNGK